MAFLEYDTVLFREMEGTKLYSIQEE